jgi:hypothetical protein
MLVVLTMNIENYVLTVLHDTTVTAVPSDASVVATTHVCKTLKFGSTA